MSPKRPTYKLLAGGFSVTGKSCEVREHKDEYALYCGDTLVGTGDADRLSEWALFVGGAKDVYHLYDLRTYGNEPSAKQFDEEHPGEGGGVRNPGEGGL